MNDSPGPVAIAGLTATLAIEDGLVFRTLTYGIQIPLGAFTYLIWRFNKSWRRPVVGEPEPQPAAPVAGS